MDDAARKSKLSVSANQGKSAKILGAPNDDDDDDNSDDASGSYNGKRDNSYSKGRQSSKFKYNKKKRQRSKRRRGGYLLPYLIVPKHKSLTKRIIARMTRENNQFKLSKAIYAARKLEKFAETMEMENLDSALEDTLGEAEWRLEKEKALAGIFSRITIQRAKIDRIKRREKRRRRKLEQRDHDELCRKRYRVDPNDPNYAYKLGYRKTRHRITKKRFMSCVDVDLFLEAMKADPELVESPLWDKKLNLSALSIEEVHTLKTHMQRFEVIVEALKQGLFDIPGAGPIPISKVRRKENKSAARDPKKKHLRWLSKYKPIKNNETPEEAAKHLKKVTDFPPIYVERKNHGTEDAEGWFNTVTSWLGKSHANEDAPAKDALKEEEDAKETAPPKNAHREKAPKESATKKGVSSKVAAPKAKGGSPKDKEVTEIFRSLSITSSIPELPPEWEENHIKINKLSPLKLGSEFPDSILRRMSLKKVNPFTQYLAVNVPKSLEKRKNFIHSIVNAKTKKEPKLQQGIDEFGMAQEQELRKLRAERKDPMQRLHQDEQDSDIWTETNTTTTGDYASWRRVPDLKVHKDEHVGNPDLDKTFHWRLLLVGIILWEIGVFVKKVLDNVYYSIFTFHLFRENVWLSETYISSPADSYVFEVLLDWLHVFMSIISLSIIKKKNECISLLYAFSLLIHGYSNISKEAHDGLMVTDGLSWNILSMLLLQAVLVSVEICLFIAYHYYSADYIRKSREFRLRKTKLHNHEINAKGTKGLNKRRLAWNYMTRRARLQTLKDLKKKYPDVKDGNFPEESLESDIKFVEAKELRLYSERHNLNLGYPYNCLKDMKRYVFGDSEQSEYAEGDREEEKDRIKMHNLLFLRKMASNDELTLDKWRRWKLAQKKKPTEPSEKPAEIEPVKVKKKRYVPLTPMPHKLMEQLTFM